jgi:hypothetical protein
MLAAEQAMNRGRPAAARCAFPPLPGSAGGEIDEANGASCCVPIIRTRCVASHLPTPVPAAVAFRRAAVALRRRSGSRGLRLQSQLPCGSRWTARVEPCIDRAGAVAEMCVSRRKVPFMRHQVSVLDGPPFLGGASLTSNRSAKSNPPGPGR